MILTGQDAFRELIKVVSQAADFCYILTPWFGPDIARPIKKVLKVEKYIIVVRDYWKGNKQCFKIFKGVQFLLNTRLHSKIVLTEQAGVEGSSNWTGKAFTRNADHVTFFQADEPNYDQLMQVAQSWIAEAVPFDNTQPTIFWNNKDRPITDLPEVLESAHPDSDSPSESKNPESEFDSNFPNSKSKTDDEKARKNISEAWRIFSGRRDKDEA